MDDMACDGWCDDGAMDGMDEWMAWKVALVQCVFVVVVVLCVDVVGAVVRLSLSSFVCSVPCLSFTLCFCIVCFVSFFHFSSLPLMFPVPYDRAEQILDVDKRLGKLRKEFVPSQETGQHTTHKQHISNTTHKQHNNTRIHHCACCYHRVHRDDAVFTLCHVITRAHIMVAHISVIRVRCHMACFFSRPIVLCFSVLHKYLLRHV
jgi:hypothetical protein